MNRTRILIFALAFLNAVCVTAKPMKARMIQPLYAMDETGLDKSFEWTLKELDDCDASLDIVVLPEFSDVPGKTVTKGFFEKARENGPVLLKKCAETARRCSTLVFCGAVDDSWDVPRNAIHVYGRDGSLIGKYYKQHVTAGEWQKTGVDNKYTREWQEPFYLDIEGIRYMFLICYDFYFYEAYANIARWKPDIIIGASHQRSDPHHVLDLIDTFCAYHTGAYLVRASVSMGKKSEVGGCSSLAAPDGKIMGNLYSKVGHLDVTFDPSKKYLKPAGYGNPPAMHSDYIEIGRRPWLYRPGGSAIVAPLSEAPTKRTVTYSNNIAVLGAAIATGTQEIAFDVDAATDWKPFVCSILQKLSCHAIMNIRLKGSWTKEARKHLEDIVFKYDAQKHVYYTPVDD